MFYNKKLYLLCSCTNPTFLNIFVPEIWPKYFSANQFAGFFNQPYLQNKSMKSPNFLHIDANSHKLNVDQKPFGWAWSKIGVVSLLEILDSKIDCFSRINWCFACWCKFSKVKSYFNDLWVGIVKNGHYHLLYETLKYAAS